MEKVRVRFDEVSALGSTLWAAFADLLDQEFGYSTGHLAAILNTCLFAPSILSFWFVNGVVDFSSAVAVGAVAGPAGLGVRLVAYVLLVPTFLLARVVVHLLHPAHRRQLLSGSCPTTQLMSLDWVSMGILTTGLPLAVQDVGPWATMNAVFLVGVFVAPRLAPTERGGSVKLAAIVLGSTLFLYANYGSVVPVAPDPGSVLGPVATARLTDATTGWLYRLLNSVLFGPVVVGALGTVLNHVFTHRALADVPVVHYALPERDPDAVVFSSGAFGTVFYLAVVAVLTGQLVVVP